MSHDDRQKDLYDNAQHDSGYDDVYDNTHQYDDLSADDAQANVTYDDSQPSYEDDWADENVSEVEQNQDQPPPKKKSSTLTVVITVVVATIVVFGFMILRGGNNNEAVTSAGQETAPVVATTTDDAGQTPGQTSGQVSVSTEQAFQEETPVEGAGAVVGAVPEQGGLMTNPEVLNQPQPAPQVETAPAAQPPTGTSLVQAISPDVKPVSDFPTVDAIKKPDTAAVPVTTPTPNVAPAQSEPVKQDVKPEVVQTAPAVPATPVVDPQVQAKLDSALERISKLEKDVSDKDAQLKAQEERVSRAAESSEDVAALKSKISDLEAKLASQKEVSASPVPAKEVVAKPAVKKSAHKVKQTAASKAYVPEKSVSVKANGWILRSARPGAAVLSLGPNGDFRSVAVGDTISGLGRVTSIRETSTGWIVQGTRGFVGE